MGEPAVRIGSPMSASIPFWHVTPSDLREVFPAIISQRSALRLARKLGAVKVGRLWAVPVIKIRESLGDEVADAAIAAAERRINAPRHAA